MPRINYKPSNWKSGETARNVITLTGARFLREAESTLRLEISSLPPDQLSTTPLLIFHRCYSPPRFSISVEINQMHEGVELPKTPLPCRRDSDQGSSKRRFKRHFRGFNFVKFRSSSDSFSFPFRFSVVFIIFWFFENCDCFAQRRKLFQGMICCEQRITVGWSNGYFPTFEMLVSGQCFFLKLEIEPRTERCSIFSKNHYTIAT